MHRKIAGQAAIGGGRKENAVRLTQSGRRLREKHRIQDLERAPKSDRRLDKICHASRKEKNEPRSRAFTLLDEGSWLVTRTFCVAGFCSSFEMSFALGKVLSTVWGA
jgi:hypothetical protein